ncbi:hypothetical protein [Streptomyces sp. CBMA123]|uniref:hypothetical protein n=1 Tax=Streptomyces sp. CBMA123 TaxID=1896313 RepID=UPI0021D5387C|nr:hypothetical protein [Streptomyces sp. CBMA123]
MRPSDGDVHGEHLIRAGRFQQAQHLVGGRRQAQAPTGAWARVRSPMWTWQPHSSPPI